MKKGGIEMANNNTHGIIFFIGGMIVINYAIILV